MRAVDIIRKKRDGQALDQAEIEAFVQGAVTGSWPEYQLAALLMAVFFRGMSVQETAALTLAMVRSGVRLDLSELPGIKVDKHSTGGVGDKTSLILAPLVASCGVVVPMMSGRGLGHTGGTLDKLESIPGFRVDLSLDEFRAALRDLGCALIGQTAEIAPADKVLYALRDVTATVESIPLITASILSKKIAEGINGLVLDVKCGRGAFMKTLPEARRLAESLTSIGAAAGLRTRAVLTRMDAPLGQAVGNSLEVIESIETLKGEGSADLTFLALLLSEAMLLMAGAVEAAAVGPRARQALSSGQALEKFRAIIERQGGDPRVIDDYDRLPVAAGRYLVRAPRPGYVTRLDAESVGRASMLLGAGRATVTDRIDPGVGMLIHCRVGDQVAEGEPLLELVHREGADLGPALRVLESACAISDVPPVPEPLVIDTLG
ncbi:MAG: thymidine phosphorylase [Gemmataceae bacterium]|nr:thymidine phosphorylase [Gemmataceae bacterium]MDW8265389.1 thymidine phosphorylase [Gemmataceae bacterium]